MTININNILGVSPDSLLSFIDEYNKADQLPIGTIIQHDKKIVVDYDVDRWAIKYIDLHLSIGGCSSLVEDAISQSLQYKKIYIVSSSHQDKIRSVVVCAFGDEKKLSSVNFKLLSQIEVLDLRIKDDAIAIFSSFNESIRYANAEDVRTLTDRVNYIARRIDLSEGLLDKASIKAFLITLGIAVNNATVDNKQELIQIMKAWLMDMHISSVEILMSLCDEIKKGNLSNNQVLVQTIGGIAQSIDFDNSPFNQINALCNLFNILSISVKHSDTQTQQRLIRVIIDLFQSINFIENPFCYAIAAEKGFNLLNVALKYADNQAQQRLFLVVGSIFQSVNFIKKPFYFGRVIEAVFKVSCSAIKLNVGDHQEALAIKSYSMRKSILKLEGMSEDALMASIRFGTIITPLLCKNRNKKMYIVDNKTKAVQKLAVEAESLFNGVQSALEFGQE